MKDVRQLELDYVCLAQNADHASAVSHARERYIKAINNNILFKKNRKRWVTWSMNCSPSLLYELFHSNELIIEKKGKPGQGGDLTNEPLS